MKITKREKLIFYLCTIVAIGALAYVYVIEPGIINTRALKVKVATKRAELRQAEEILIKKEKIQIEYAEFWRRLTSKQTKDEKFAQIFIDLEALSKKSGVKQLTNIMPLFNEEESQGPGMYQNLSVQVALESSLEGLVNFMYEILNSPHIFGIQKLQIIPDNETPALLRSQIVITTVFIGKKIALGDDLRRFS